MNPGTVLISCGFELRIPKDRSVEIETGKGEWNERAGERQERYREVEAAVVPNQPRDICPRLVARVRIKFISR